MAGSEIPEPQVPRVTAADLADWLKAGREVPVFDARPAGSYRAEHIAGARSLPARDLKPALASLPSGVPIVFY